MIKYMRSIREQYVLCTADYKLIITATFSKRGIKMTARAMHSCLWPTFGSFVHNTANPVKEDACMMCLTIDLELYLQYRSTLKANPKQAINHMKFISL